MHGVITVMFYARDPEAVWKPRQGRFAVSLQHANQGLYPGDSPCMPRNKESIRSAGTGPAMSSAEA